MNLKYLLRQPLGERMDAYTRLRAEGKITADDVAKNENMNPPPAAPPADCPDLDGCLERLSQEQAAEALDVERLAEALKVELNRIHKAGEYRELAESVAAEYARLRSPENDR